MAKIKCRSCGRVVAETTDKFNPDVRPDGSMLRLVDPYKSWGWTKIMCWTDATMCNLIFCPNCEFPLAPHGRFNLVEIDRVGEAARKRQEMIELLEASKDVPQELWDEAQRLVEGVDAANPEETCPKCGKPESGFKSRSGFLNHQRYC